MKKEVPLINIPDPCNQKWEDMIAVDKNRFCTLCNKNIIDFTNKSNAEIKAYFTNNNEKVCGRFLNTQMQNHSFVKKSNYAHYSFKLIPLLLALGIPNFSLSKNKKIEVNYSFSKVDNSDQRDQKLQVEVAQKKYISGKVTNINGEPIVGAFVVFNTKQTGTHTDKEGVFKLKIPAEILENIQIQISFVGYETKLVTIPNANNKNLITVKLEETEDFLLGEVIYFKQKKWWQFWK